MNKMATIYYGNSDIEKIDTEKIKIDYVVWGTQDIHASASIGSNDIVLHINWNVLVNDKNGEKVFNWLLDQWIVQQDIKRDKKKNNILEYWKKDSKKVKKVI